MAAGLDRASVIQSFLEESPMVDELINETDSDGWTPLHWSCRSSSWETVQRLLSKSVNKEAITDKGWLPIHVAIHHCQKYYRHAAAIHFKDHKFRSMYV